MFIYGTVEEDYDEDGENGKRSNEERRVMNCGNAYGTSKWPLTAIVALFAHRTQWDHVNHCRKKMTECYC